MIHYLWIINFIDHLVTFHRPYFPYSPSCCSDRGRHSIKYWFGGEVWMVRIYRKSSSSRCSTYLEWTDDWCGSGLHGETSSRTGFKRQPRFRSISFSVEICWRYISSIRLVKYGPWMDWLSSVEPWMSQFFQGFSNDIAEERNQKQNESVLDLDVDGTKGMIIRISQSLWLIDYET